MTASDEARDRNQAAWNLARHETWVESYGAPQVAAQAIIADPTKPLRRLLPHLGDLAGRDICNLQGSHGRVAVALALLGARATVIDFAEENRRYALALAAAAGVDVDYVLGNVMEAGPAFAGRFDIVVMELGVLHYHQDLTAFFHLCAHIARPHGRLLLNEFHPVQRKLFSDLGTGDYFDSQVILGAAPFPPSVERPAEAICAYRFWTLGETLGAVLAAGWRIAHFEEHPDWDDARLPGTFTLVAERA